MSIAKNKRLQAILVTAGAKGAAYDIWGQQGFVPCFSSCKIVETTGAGDAFSAGYIAKCIQLLKSSGSSTRESGGASSSGSRVGFKDIELDSEGEVAKELVRFGSAVGALTCGGDGAIVPQPSMAQVLDLLAEE